MEEIAVTSEPAVEKLASEAFQIAYGGSDVARGSMNVRELAPALAALDDLIERSNELLNGEKSRIELRVLADFESGSFDVNLLLQHVLVDPSAALLPTLGALNAKQLLDVVVGTYDKAKGLISGVAKIYKVLHGEKPKEIRNGDTKETRILVFGNNNTIVTDVNSAKLYGDARVRNALTRAAQPLTHSGINSMALRRNDEIIETLDAEDVGSIDLADAKTGETPDGKGAPRELWVRVVKPNFDGGRWSFHDGSAKFGAELEDSDFQARVNRRDQGFYKGDTFLVRLHSIQHIDKNGNLSTRNVVEKVLDQREGPRQQKLLP
jgi:hypothetical protein